VSVPMTLSDLERQDARVKLFRRISLTLVPMGIGRCLDLQMGADCRPNVAKDHDVAAVSVCGELPSPWGLR